MKTLKWAWIYFWAYIFVGLELVDKLGDWVGHQIDHNDYLAGFVGAVCLMAIPYLVGIIDIVVRG